MVQARSAPADHGMVNGGAGLSAANSCEGLGGLQSAPDTFRRRPLRQTPRRAERASPSASEGFGEASGDGPTRAQPTLSLTF
jgi:hypothetical protein